MKRHAFGQGTAAWHAHRATARNASEASAMLGCSPYMTRAELLHAMHTGLRPEASGHQQRRFDAGHAIEAAQRDLAAEIIGEPLYPVVGSEVVDGLELSASFDGLTMAEDVGYEAKTLNDELRACLEAVGGIDGNDGRRLPKHYRVQMEQQLMVSGAERVLFVAATEEGEDVRRCWYLPDPALRAEILAGWRQFDVDLAAYVPPAGAAVIVAEPVQALPAVHVAVSGTITVADNFKVFETAFRDFIEHRLIRAPKSDQDFADLDVQIKAMKGAEAALEAGEAGMLAQVSAIDAAKKTKDMLLKLVRDNRLMAEKLLAGEKERRRGEIVAGGITALREHTAALNARWSHPYMPAAASAADFGAAIKGKSNLAKMEEAVAALLLSAKVQASTIADGIDLNLRALPALVGDRTGLTPDLALLVLKNADDFAAVVGQRVTAQRDAEQRRAEELAERERAKIRAEEAARLQREQDAEAQRQADAARQAAAAMAPPVPPAVVVQVAAPAAAPVVVPMPTKAPAAATTAPTLRLGQINERLAPLQLDAAGLAALGFPHSATDKAAKLWHEHQFETICEALERHVANARERYARKAA